MELVTTETAFNAEGVPVDTFVRIRKALAGPWSRTMLQQYAISGTDRENTIMYVVRHAPNYDGITRAKVQGCEYELTDVQQEPVPGPRAYDLLTMREVHKRGN